MTLYRARVEIRCYGNVDFETHGDSNAAFDKARELVRKMSLKQLTELITSATVDVECVSYRRKKRVNKKPHTGSDLPKVGDIIYVPDLHYRGRDGEEGTGGKAHVTAVTHHKKGVFHVVALRIKEHASQEYFWNTLRDRQEELRDVFKNHWAATKEKK